MGDLASRSFRCLLLLVANEPFYSLLYAFFGSPPIWEYRPSGINSVGRSWQSHPHRRWNRMHDFNDRFLSGALLALQLRTPVFLRWIQSYYSQWDMGASTYGSKCRWMQVVVWSENPDGSIDRDKASPSPKAFIKDLALIILILYVRSPPPFGFVFLCLALFLGWPLKQLDVNNAFFMVPFRKRCICQDSFLLISHGCRDSGSISTV